MTPTITLIDTTRLKPNPNNPRKNIGDITALADSIRAHGIQQELVVTPIADSTDYRVVIGHRRLAASQQAGLAQVPCRIMELSPKDERELMVIENTQRHDLTPIEEADAYQGLLDLGSSIENMAEKQRRAYAREQTKKARELHDASQALRAEWIHKTQNTWKKPMMQQALLHLVDGEILGNDEYRFPAGSGDINWSDKTIAAYNRMTTPLPITGKDPDNGIWHITTGKNLDELRRRARTDNTRQLQLILILLARREADINPGAWTNKNQLDSLQRINDYYQALELLGYKPSDAETQALAGSLIEVMKEGDDHDDDNDAE